MKNNLIFNKNFMISNFIFISLFELNYNNDSLKI